MPSNDEMSTQRASEARGFRWLLGTFAVIFFVILVARFEVIDSPPYFDFAIGLWTEAQFLADSDFDYYRLRYVEDHAMSAAGGSRSYMTSILPSVVAICMVAAPSPRAALVAYHLLIFACASGALTIVYLLLRPACGTVGAGLLTVAAGTTPVFAVQVDMAGMEMPLIFATLLTVHAVAKRRYPWAALASNLAFFIKPTGLIVTLAVLCFFLLHILFISSSVGRQSIRRGIVASIASLLFQYGVLYWGGSLSLAVHASNAPFLLLALVWFPDLVAVFVAFLGAMLVSSLIWVRPQWRSTASLPIGRRCRVVLQQTVDGQAFVIFLGILVLGLLLAMHAVYFLPRYMAIVVPCVYLLAGLTIYRSRRWQDVVLLGIIAVNLVNWNGMLYPSLLTAQRHMHGDGEASLLERNESLFERSHEYLRTHRSNILAMRQLEKLAEGRPIVAGHPYNFFMAYPALGYVSRPLAGYSTIPFPKSQSALRSVQDLIDDAPSELILIWAANTFGLGFSEYQIREPSGVDRILYDDQLPSRLVIYERNFSGGEAEIRRALLVDLWSQNNVRSGYRLANAIRDGQSDFVMEVLSAQISSAAGFDMARAALLANLLQRRGAAAQANALLLDILQIPEKQHGPPLARIVSGEYRSNALWANCEAPRFLDLDSRNETSPFELGLKLLEENQYDQAGWHFLASALRQSPSLHQVLLHLRRGYRALEQGGADDALAEFRHALLLEPGIARTHYYLGLAYAQLGQTSDCLTHLDRASSLQPGDFQLQHDTGVALAESRQWKRAIDRFELALELEGKSTLARQNLRRAKAAQQRTDQ